MGAARDGLKIAGTVIGAFTNGVVVSADGWAYEGAKLCRCNRAIGQIGAEGCVQVCGQFFLRNGHAVEVERLTVFSSAPPNTV